MIRILGLVAFQARVKNLLDMCEVGVRESKTDPFFSTKSPIK